MNPKQFISSCVFKFEDLFVSLVPSIRRVIPYILRILFPTMGYERVTSTMMRPQVFLCIYILGFSFCFVLQAIVAFQYGNLLENQDDSGRIVFLRDWNNLINYTVIVPLYLVAGIGYAISLFSIEERMSAYGFKPVKNADKIDQPLFYGAAAVAVFIFVLILAQATYAIDIQNSKIFFWFHSTSPGAPLEFNGHLYLLINNILCAFVIIIALLHIELYRWSITMSRSINYYAKNHVGGEHEFFRDGDKIKEILAPFTETAIWSKGFAVLLAMNLYTWLESDVSGGASTSVNSEPNAKEASIFFRYVTVLYYVIAIWLVSLPRYRVQYRIFVRQKQLGIHAYLDIRMPWTVGWSVFIDFLLVAFFSTYILGAGGGIEFFISIIQGDPDS